MRSNDSKNIPVESVGDWPLVVEEILGEIEEYKVILLSGELGVGKTTLVQAMADSLHIMDRITSPTFSLVQEYRTQKNEIIYHLDLYRLNSYEEVIGAGIVDLIESEEYYCMFIEWPGLIHDALDGPYISLEINISKGEKRDVRIKYIEK